MLPLRVSTHSRPKAAGTLTACPHTPLFSFNTQPPEGGWMFTVLSILRLRRFNTQPPEGGWFDAEDAASRIFSVSTHSRPKAAGYYSARRRLDCRCFNTQPPEGGWMKAMKTLSVQRLFQHTAARRRLVQHLGQAGTNQLCFNTQPPEGGWDRQPQNINQTTSFNTQPPEGGWFSTHRICCVQEVSTHSRPKAAGWHWRCGCRFG